MYPVYETLDEAGRRTAVHVDFGVVGSLAEEDPVAVAHAAHAAQHPAATDDETKRTITGLVAIGAVLAILLGWWLVHPVAAAEPGRAWILWGVWMFGGLPWVGMREQARTQR